MFSFSRRKKIIDLQPFLRRLVDVNTPNLDPAGSLSDRVERRANRSIPTLVCAWEYNQPRVETCVTAMTRDLSDRGVGLVATHPIRYEQIVLGFAVESDPEDPWYFLGTPRHSTPLGGGYWSIGIELHEFANADHYSRLQVLRSYAIKLLPPALQLACSEQQ